MACSTYILGDLKDRLTMQIQNALSTANIAMPALRVVVDSSDPDQQTLLVEYPSLETSGKDDYIESKIKIEPGAKSALDPTKLITITPYIGQEFIGGDLSVANVPCMPPSSFLTRTANRI